MCWSKRFERRRLRILFTITAATAVSLSMGARSLSAADRQTTTSGKMLIRVIDEAGQPVASVHVRVSVWTADEQFKRRRSYTADAGGLATIDLPATLQIVRVWASAKGYVGMFAQTWPQSPIDAHPLPDEFKFVLSKGTTMGGIVTDDEGKPIQGARVEVRYDSGAADNGSDPSASYISELATGIMAKRTDKQGRWKVDRVPPGDGVNVRIKLNHRDYVADQSWGGMQKEQHVTSTELRNQSAVLVMHLGTVVHGKVTDPHGNPVKNAVVIQDEGPYWRTHAPAVETDSNGQYHFVPLASKPMRFTVLAEGWMPQTRVVDVAHGLPPVDFHLAPGRTLDIKFVDPAGNPIPKVTVTPDKWRGAGSLYTRNSSKAKIPRIADEHGVFTWKWAPDDAIDFTFRAEGHANTEATLTADDTQHVQTMQPTLWIAGTVTDATTGEPVKRFTAVPVIHFRPDFPMLNRREATRHDGNFSLEFERTNIEHGVQIEAPGYLTYRTERRYQIGDDSPTLDVELQPIEPQVGTVVDANGRGVEGVRVYAATSFQHLDLYDMEDRDGSDSSNYGILTDARGEFEIPGQIDRYALVAVAPQGYATVDRDAKEMPGQLRLEPWASVRGRVIQDGKAMADYRVRLMPIRIRGGGEPRVDIRFNTVTDERGQFAFERVPPGACHVRPDLHFSVESPLKSSRSAPLDLAPGEHATVALGGGGVEVTGQLVLDTPRDDFDFHFSLSYLLAQRPGIETPESLAEKGFDWQGGWTDAWRNSQEGGAYLKTLHQWFVKPDPDGKFRISGVEPGDYQFAVALYGSTKGCLVHPIAKRVVPVTVSPGEPALKLGRITIPTQDVPQVGDVAANFEFTSPDGNSTDLAAMRGKYVLVDFWATWCGPCVTKLAEVEAIRKEFGTDNRLIVVGANLDADKERAGEFLKKRPLPWHHALLGDWSSTEVPQRYGVVSVPAYVLIDPDGKIAAMEYLADNIKAKLQTALADKPDR